MDWVAQYNPSHHSLRHTEYVKLAEPTEDVANNMTPEYRE